MHQHWGILTHWHPSHALSPQQLLSSGCHYSAWQWEEEIFSATFVFTRAAASSQQPAGTQADRGGQCGAAWDWARGKPLEGCQNRRLRYTPWRNYILLFVHIEGILTEPGNPLSLHWIFIKQYNTLQSIMRLHKKLLLISRLHITIYGEQNILQAWEEISL